MKNKINKPKNGKTTSVYSFCKKKVTFSLFSFFRIISRYIKYVYKKNAFYGLPCCYNSQCRCIDSILGPKGFYVFWRNFLDCLKKNCLC